VAIFKLLLIENETFYRNLGVIESSKILLAGIILSTLSSIFLFIKDFEIKKLTIFFDYFSILILNYYFTPLLAFTMYFCFLHSIRHSITLIFELNEHNLKNGLKIFIKKASPLTFLTTILCIISIYLLSDSYDLDNSILKVIFIGLASLTFPHILLEYFLEKNEK
jgi:Brp/Blh family beta-carotene 15,15'-monooxygenase